MPRLPQVTGNCLRHVRAGCDPVLSDLQREQSLKHIKEGSDFVLPLRQRIDDGLDTRDLLQASTSAPIPPHNRGYILLQKMGWKGSGLGRDATGMPRRQQNRRNTPRWTD